jgi:hypothetical protein
MINEYCLLRQDSHDRKVLIYTECHSVCPLVGIRTPPAPIPQASVPPPPGTKGKGEHSPAGGVWGSPNSDDWRKSLALFLLCGHDSAVSVIYLLQI